MGYLPRFLNHQLIWSLVVSVSGYVTYDFIVSSV